MIINIVIIVISIIATNNILIIAWNYSGENSDKDMDDDNGDGNDDEKSAYLFLFLRPDSLLPPQTKHGRCNDLSTKQNGIVG